MDPTKDYVYPAPDGSFEFVIVDPHGKRLGYRIPRSRDSKIHPAAQPVLIDGRYEQLSSLVSGERTRRKVSAELRRKARDPRFCDAVEAELVSKLSVNVLSEVIGGLQAQAWVIKEPEMDSTFQLRPSRLTQEIILQFVDHALAPQVLIIEDLKESKPGSAMHAFTGRVKGWCLTATFRYSTSFQLIDLTFAAVETKSGTEPED